jgi:hypothetical protein
VRRMRLPQPIFSQFGADRRKSWKRLQANALRLPRLRRPHCSALPAKAGARFVHGPALYHCIGFEPESYTSGGKNRLIARDFARWLCIVTAGTRLLKTAFCHPSLSPKCETSTKGETEGTSSCTGGMVRRTSLSGDVGLGCHPAEIDGSCTR